RIAEALENQSPDVMENQPELFAQHYAEAGLAEKAVAYWGKAGRRSAARSAMAEAAAQFQKGLDQLALLSDNSEHQRQELEICSSLGSRRRATPKALPSVPARFAPPDEDVAFLADLLTLPASERHPLPNLSPQRKKAQT